MSSSLPVDPFGIFFHAMANGDEDRAITIIKNNNLSVFSEFCWKSYSSDSIFKESMKLLHIAFYFGRMKVITFLLERGAYIESATVIRTPLGYTDQHYKEVIDIKYIHKPYELAIINNRLNVIQHFWPTYSNTRKLKVLYTAIKNKAHDIVYFCSQDNEFGEYIRTHQDREYNLLKEACVQRDRTIIDILLSIRCPSYVSRDDRYCRTDGPFEVCVSNDDIGILNAIFRKNGTYITEPESIINILKIACFEDSKECFEYLLNTMNINRYKVITKESLLCIAIFNKSIKITKYLLPFNLDENLPCEKCYYYTQDRSASYRFKSFNEDFTIAIGEFIVNNNLENVYPEMTDTYKRTIYINRLMSGK